MEQNRIKQQANQHCTERKFEVGDWVFINLQPYKQISLKKKNKDNKLAPQNYGQYKVLERIGSMAYKLEFPPSSRIHLVFHVSFLKKVIENKIPLQTIFLEINEEGEIKLETKTIIETIIMKLRNR